MKRFNNILAVVFVLAALVGCENNVDTPTPKPSLDPNAKYILFDANVVESRSQAINDASGVNSFSVYGYNYISGTEWDAWRALAKPNVFDNTPQAVTRTTDGFFSYAANVADLKTWSDNYPRHSFFAVYPEKSVGASCGITYPVMENTEGVPYVTYTLPNDATKMVDLMTGAYLDRTYSEHGTYVSFDMEHRLAAVDVVALNHYEDGNDLVTIRIKSLKVTFDNLLYNSADIYLDKIGRYGTPSVRRTGSGSAEYTIVTSDYNVLNNKYDDDQRNISNEVSKTMFFIPQELDMDNMSTTNLAATVEVTYQKVKGANADGTGGTLITTNTYVNAEGETVTENIPDGNFTILKSISFNRSLEQSYRYYVRLTFTSAAVSITVLTAEKWADIPVDYEFS